MTTTPSLGKLVIVALLALAVAFQVARTAVVSTYVATNPALAAKVWPAHPRVALATAMGDIGVSAAAGKGASPRSVAVAMAAAQRSPLSAEPFLIAGAVAISRGRLSDAESLFGEARRRDPRSAAARYFLAQQYLSSGRPVEGLAEASALTRLVSGSSDVLVPGLVKYAREPGAQLQVRKIIAADPKLGDRVLESLAKDPANAALVLALAGDSVGANNIEVAAWQTVLLGSLVDRGDIAMAHRFWRRISGLAAPRPGLFNPQFAKIAAPAPFNWTFGSGTFGVAEPSADGRLQVIYYGRDDAVLASQLLVLAPGAYELRMQVTRDGTRAELGGLVWSLTCQPGVQPLLALPLASKATGTATLAGRLVVPPNCPAQLLALNGKAQEFAQSEQVTIGNLELMRMMR